MPRRLQDDPDPLAQVARPPLGVLAEDRDDAARCAAGSPRGSRPSSSCRRRWGRAGRRPRRGATSKSMPRTASKCPVGLAQIAHEDRGSGRGHSSIQAATTCELPHPACARLYRHRLEHDAAARRRARPRAARRAVEVAAHRAFVRLTAEQRRHGVPPEKVAGDRRRRRRAGARPRARRRIEALRVVATAALRDAPDRDALIGRRRAARGRRRSRSSAARRRRGWRSRARPGARRPRRQRRVAGRRRRRRLDRAGVGRARRRRHAGGCRCRSAPARSPTRICTATRRRAAELRRRARRGRGRACRRRLPERRRRLGRRRQRDARCGACAARAHRRGARRARSRARSRAAGGRGRARPRPARRARPPAARRPARCSPRSAARRAVSVAGRRRRPARGRGPRPAGPGRVHLDARGQGDSHDTSCSPAGNGRVIGRPLPSQPPA